MDVDVDVDVLVEVVVGGVELDPVVDEDDEPTSVVLEGAVVAGATVELDVVAVGSAEEHPEQTMTASVAASRIRRPTLRS